MKPLIVFVPAEFIRNFSGNTVVTALWVSCTVSYTAVAVCAARNIRRSTRAAKGIPPLAACAGPVITRASGRRRRRGKTTQNYRTGARGRLVKVSNNPTVRRGKNIFKIRFSTVIVAPKRRNDTGYTTSE